MGRIKQLRSLHEMICRRGWSSRLRQGFGGRGFGDFGGGWNVGAVEGERAAGIGDGGGLDVWLIAALEPFLDGLGDEFLGG